MNEAYHIIKSLSSYFFINSHMSCKCITCKVGITDKETHEVNEPVKSLYEKNSSSIIFLISASFKKRGVNNLFRSAILT